jgi:hypothetical protein
MTTQLITIQGVEGFALSTADDAFDKRDELALQAGTVQTVMNADQAAHASALLTEMKGFTRLIEESRKEVKAPVLEVERKIDQLATDLTEQLEAECARVSKLVGTYLTEQKRIAEEAQRRAWEEEQRIIREAEAKRQADEADQRKRFEELTQAAAKARSEKKAAEYELEKRLSQVRADEAARRHDEETASRIVSTRTAAVLTPPKTAGIATRRAIKFEVTDIHALYAARPELVKLEPATVVINAVIRGKLTVSIPGLRVWEESTAIVR